MAEDRANNDPIEEPGSGSDQLAADLPGGEQLTDDDSSAGGEAVTGGEAATGGGTGPTGDDASAGETAPVGDDDAPTGGDETTEEQLEADNPAEEETLKALDPDAPSA